jgi:formylglycine-generating enzyme required for sulfatase activity
MGSAISGKAQRPVAPIESINFDEVLDFCHKSGMRLPSEAEWEFACKAGSGGSRYGPLDAVAWHSSNSQATTHPIGQKLPNPLGFHDMLGNVRELCADVYRWESYAECLKGVIDPVGPASGALRVCRGGTFLMGSRELRSTYRSYVKSSRRDVSTGFRPARTP